MHEGPHVTRLRFIMVLTTLLWLVLWGNVGVIQGYRGRYYREISEDQRVKPITLTARRGSILDRNGVQLAMDVSSASYELRPKEIVDPAATARELSRASGVSESTIRDLISSGRDHCWLLRQAEPDVMRRIDALELSGVRKIREYRRCFPFGGAGAQMIGYCDVDGKGIEGSELYANDSLMGRNGRSVALLDALGRGGPTLNDPSIEPVNGLDVVLTIDWKIQQIVDEELSDCVESLDALWGGAIVLDPHTAEILAITNVPHFDPGKPSSVSPEFRRNRIVTDMVEPGSTFKIVTFIEALESGAITEDDPIDCENGQYRIGRHTINDSHKLGIVPASEVLIHSSNIGAVKIADMLGKRRLYERARLMGFGTITGLDVPDESQGILPNPKTWSNLTLPTVSFGHGVSVTPIQLAMSYASVANGGTLLRPRLIKRIAGTENRPGQNFETRTIRRVMLPETAERIERMLCEVVESGTGQTVKLPNVALAGKTGTAQRVREDGRGYESGRYISSFIGYLADCEPKLVCLVMVDSPKGQYYGSQVAGPVFKRIINRILNMGDSPVMAQVAAVTEKTPAVIENTVPDVKGMDIRVAVAKLTALGFEPSVNGDSTTVSRQVPQAGAVLRNGSRVTLHSSTMTVEAGNRVRMPELTGKTIREAVQHLNQAQLDVKVSGSGVVRRQSPAPGTLVEYGTVCMLVCEKR